EEERRLAYVGITRAMALLYITYAFMRGRFGQSEFSEPSRFLQALPEEAIERNAQAPKVSIAPGVKPGYRTTGGYAGSTGHGRNGGAGSQWWGGGRGQGGAGNGAGPSPAGPPPPARGPSP